MALQGTEFCNHELKKIIYTMKIVFDTYHNKVIQTVKLLWNYVYCEKHYKNKPWLDLTAGQYLGGGGTGLCTLKQSPWAWLGPW